jgi:hypothetical protein
MNVSKSTLALALALIAGQASAQYAELSKKVSNFTNSDCKKTDTCGLKSAEMRVIDYSILIKKTANDLPQYGTKMFASYETENLEDLETYGFAQFIQGCQYISKKEKNGEIKNYDVTQKEFMGSYINYSFPQMVMDGFNRDPLSWSFYPNRGRHDDYHVVDPSLDKGLYFKEYIPKENRLYISDRPDVVGFYPDSQRAYNMSVKFKLCLYKSADVPKFLADIYKIDFAKPIHCFEWASSNIWNYEKGRFEKHNDIAPFCKTLKHRPAH